MDTINKAAKRKTQSLSHLLLSSSSLGHREGDNKLENVIRPKTAPPSADAGRKLLSSRAYKNKSFYRRQQTRAASSRQSETKSRRSRPPTSHFSRPTTSTTIRETPQPQRSASSVAVVKTSGYSIHRSPSKVTMNIKPDLFFGDKPVSSGSNEVSLKQMSQTMSMVVGPLQAALEEAIKAQQGLQLEVAQLTLKIEDLKEEHGEHIKDLETEFEAERIQQTKAHEIMTKELKAQHEREMDFLHNTHSDQMQNLKQNHRSEIATLEAKVEYVSELLESTKVQMQKEAEESLEKMRQKLRKKHELELEQIRVDLKEEGKQQLARQREAMNLKHQEEIKELKEEHEGEIKILLSQLKKADELEEKLEESNKKILSLESEVELLNKELKQSHLEKLEVEAQLLETKEKLKTFEDEFLDKVKAVEVSYRDRMDALMTENTVLRRRWLEKTDQFSRYQSDIENSRAQTIRNFKDTIQVVVKARSKADVSVAFGALEDLSIISSSRSRHHTHKRPQSAPTTQMETLRACRSATTSPAVASPRSLRLNTQLKSSKEGSSLATKSEQQIGNTSTIARYKPRPQSCLVPPTYTS